MARDFNGSSQYLQASKDYSTFSTLTVGFWVYIDAYSGSFQMLVEHTADGQATTGGFGAYLDHGSTVFSVTHRGGTGAALANYSRPSTGAWHHILLTYDFTLSTDEVNYWLNGSIQTASSRPFNNNNSSSDTFANSTLNAGARNAASLHFDGKLAELAVWGGVSLGTAEAGALADGVSPLLIRPASLVDYWPLWGRGSPEPNLAGGTNFTVTGAAQSDHPRVFMPRRAKVFLPAAAAPPASLVWHPLRGPLAPAGSYL